MASVLARALSKTRARVGASYTAGAQVPTRANGGAPRALASSAAAEGNRRPEQVRVNDGPLSRGRAPRPTSLVQRQELWRLDHGVAARELGGPDGGSADGRLDQLERIVTLPTSESRR